MPGRNPGSARAAGNTGSLAQVLALDAQIRVLQAELEAANHDTTRSRASSSWVRVPKDQVESKREEGRQLKIRKAAIDAQLKELVPQRDELF